MRAERAAELRPVTASKAPGDQLVKLFDSYKFLFNRSKISNQIVLSVNFIIILTFSENDI